MTILVTDDSQLIRKMLSAFIEKAGFEVIEAKNGKEALEVIDNHELECIFLDLIMPEMDGFDVLKVLSEKADVPPVVVLTADIQDVVKKECLELGAVTFLNKPPKEPEIKSVLEHVLG